jgi:hypothetical protein
MYAFDGEDEYVLAEAGLGPGKLFVDIGAGDGITWSNTLYLARNGWRGLAIECDQNKLAVLRELHSLSQVAVLGKRLNPCDAVGELRRFGVPDVFDCMSVDIDGVDAWMIESILKEMRPAIIIAEFNHYVPPPIRFCMNLKNDFVWGKDQLFGASIQHLCDVCEDYGYGLSRAFLTNAAFKHGSESASPVKLWEEQVLPAAIRNNGQHSIPMSWPPGNKDALANLAKFFGDSGAYQLSMERLDRNQL